MPEPDGEIRRRMRRAVDEAEAASRRRAAAREPRRTGRRRISGAVPVAL